LNRSDVIETIKQLRMLGAMKVSLRKGELTEVEFEKRPQKVIAVTAEQLQKHQEEQEKSDAALAEWSSAP